MKNTLRSTTNKTRHSFSHAIVPVLFFELLFNIGLLLLIKPLFKGFIKLLLALSGQTILLNEQIKNYLFSAVGMISMLLVFFLAVLVIFYEFVVIFNLIDASNKNERLKFRQILRDSFKSLRLLLDPRFLILGFYFILLIPLLDLGVNSSLLPQLFVPNFIMDEVFKHSGGKILIYFLSLLAILLFVRFLFSLPYMVLENDSIKKANIKSKQVTKGRLYQLSFVIFLIIIIWTALAGIPLYIFRQFTGITAMLISLVLALIYGLTSISLSPLILNFVYVIYAEGQDDIKLKQRDKIDFKIIKAQFVHYTKALKNALMQHKWLIVIPIPFILLNISALWSNSLDYIPFHDPYVIGHRGSLEGVENTVEAVNNAYEQGAQFAEIDILLSKDGVPMVIHDNNLKRLANKNVKIANLTQDEIEALTIKSHDYTGKIVSLDKFVSEINPEIKLLIELKSHGKETESIIDQTISILEDFNFEDYLFQTAEFDLLLETKEKYPRLELGYIVIGKFGWLSQDIIETIPADFLVFEESLVNQKLVDAVHRGNKAVYAWTVNNAQSARNLYELGVDGIISDYPGKIKIERDAYINK